MTQWIRSMVTLLSVCSLVALGLSQAVAQGENTGAEMSPYRSQQVANGMEVAPFDLQFSFDASAASGAAGNAGSEFDGTYYYTTRWASNLIHKYDLTGTLVQEFSIPGVSGLRDLAFDGTYMYGGAAANTVYQMDFNTMTLIGTIPSPVAVRHIAYDAGEDGFWVGTWDTPLTLISRTGTTMNSIPNVLVGKYGSAYDAWSDGGPYLWVFDQGSGADTPQLVHQFDIAAGAATGFTYDVGADFPTSVQDIAGGLFAAIGVIPGTTSLGGLLQGTPNFFFVYELTGSTVVDPVINVGPTTISESLSPGDSIDVTVTILNAGGSDLTWEAAITSSVARGRTQTGRPITLTAEPTLISRGPSVTVTSRQQETNPPTEGGVSLILDDGSKDNSIGLTAGGQFIWLNRFTPDPGDFPFTLEEVSALFDIADGINIGETVDVYIYEDTDGDGNPGTGAVHLGSIIGADVQANDAITFSTWPTSVQLNGPGDVIIALVNRVAGVGAGTFPAAFDQTASQARSWVGTYTAGNPPNPPPLPATSLWGEIGTFGFPGNWMVRGAGTAGGGGGMVDWISLVGTTLDTIAAGGSATFDVRLRGVEAATEADTTYTGTIEVTSNDPITPSVLINVTLVVTSSNPEPLMSLTHAPGNLSMGIFNDGSIGAEQIGFTGPGISWNGTPGCFVGGPIFGTTTVGAVNGLIGSFTIYGDLVNVGSNFGGGFTSDGDFDEISSADLDDSGAAAPYGVKILQRSYSNTGEEAGFIRYGFVNNSGDDLTDFYSGIFLDWDIGDYLTNSGGYDTDRNMIYQLDGVASNPYFGLIALDGISGGRATTDTPPGSVQAGSFEYITTFDFTVLPNGDFRSWIGAGPFNINPADTVWASWGIVAGGDLAELQANADAAIAKAVAVGWIKSTGVGDPTAEIPAEYGLSQNYPNPFNPATRITYALPEEASVTLRVYNVLGQEVITLESSVQQAGLHEVSWNGKNTLGQSVGSGVYFYRLEAKGASGETFANLKKMLFLK